MRGPYPFPAMLHVYICLACVVLRGHWLHSAALANVLGSAPFMAASATRLPLLSPLPPAWQAPLVTHSPALLLAPHPPWQVPPVKRARRLRQGYCFIVVFLLPLATFMIMLATYMNAALHAFPFFTYCHNWADGVTCDEAFGRNFLYNLGNWAWTTLLVVLGFQLVIQPTLWLATDGGPCCKSAREFTTSYTESCLHLMLRVLAFQLVAALVSAGAFFFVAGGWDRGIWGARFDLEDFGCAAQLEAVLANATLAPPGSVSGGGGYAHGVDNLHGGGGASGGGANVTRGGGLGTPVGAGGHEGGAAEMAASSRPLRGPNP